MFNKGANSHIWKKTEALLEGTNLSQMMGNMSINNDKVNYSPEDLKKAKYGDTDQAKRLMQAKLKK